MIKYFCDRCECESARLYPIDIFVHIAGKSENSTGGRTIGGYVDLQSGEPVSGRTRKIELCLKCYNEVMYPLWENIKNQPTGATNQP